MEGGVFGLLFALLLVAIVFFIGAFLINSFFQFMPLPSGASASFYNPLKLIYVSVFGIFDNSFLFIVLFISALMVVGAYLHPSYEKAIGDFVLMFAMAFTWLLLSNILPVLNLALYAKTTMPNTYAFFTNPYELFLLFFISIISVILNINGMHKKKDKAVEYEHAYRNAYASMPYDDR